MKEEFLSFPPKGFLVKIVLPLYSFHCSNKFLTPGRESAATLVCFCQKLQYKRSLLSTGGIMDVERQSYFQALSLFTKDGHYSVIASAHSVCEQSCLASRC